MKKLLVRLQANSVRDLLKVTFAIVIVSFLGISAVNLAYMRSIANASARQIENIEFANSLARQGQERVVQEGWKIVSGRQNFDESSIYSEMENIQRGLSRLWDSTTALGGRQMVEAAISAADAMENYVVQLQQQVEDGVPVSAQQQTLDEIGKTADSLFQVLQEFAYTEINDIASANSQLQKTVLFVMAFLIALILVAVGTAFAAYKMLKEAVERPGIELAAMADRIQKGDLDTQVAPSNLEELNRLSDGLNSMAKRIQALVNSNITEQKNLRKSELRALQAQIAPHFLYNTLDTIVWLAECGHTEEVVHVTMAVSNFYRIALSQGRDFIPVTEEVQHIKEYLIIQKMRYDNLLRYTIEIDPAMEKSYMLKLLLQPIVENALYHGIKNKRNGGTIAITGRFLANGSLHFVVADDGIGMDGITLEKLKNGITAEGLPVSSGYGLYNVNQRLRLFYNAADLAISSEYGKGTRVEFVLPPKQEEEV